MTDKTLAERLRSRADKFARIAKKLGGHDRTTENLLREAADELDMSEKAMDSAAESIAVGIVRTEAAESRIRELEEALGRLQRLLEDAEANMELVSVATLGSAIAPAYLEMWVDTHNSIRAALRGEKQGEKGE